MLEDLSIDPQFLPLPGVTTASLLKSIACLKAKSEQLSIPEEGR